MAGTWKQIRNRRQPKMVKLHILLTPLSNPNVTIVKDFSWYCMFVDFITKMYIMFE